MADATNKTEIDIDQLKADFGDFYQKGSQGLANLHLLPMQSFDTRDAFTIINTDDTILRESNVEFESILQQYQDEYTPKGGVAFKPRQIPLFQMKVDQRFNPTKLMRSWVAFLTDNNVDRATWPFVRWIAEVYLTKKSMEEMEKEAIYNGVHEDAEEGVPGEAAKVMNGVRFLVKEFVDAGDLTEIVTGAPNADPALFVTQVETFVKSFPEKYRRLAMPINMSLTNEELYVEGMQKKYNLNYAQVSEFKKLKNYPSITVIGRPSMEGQNGMWATPKYNAIMGVKGFENSTAYKIESAERFVKMFGDWWTGIGFIQPELLFVNDLVSL